jgi:hypothetical protein
MSLRKRAFTLIAPLIIVSGAAWACPTVVGGTGAPGSRIGMPLAVTPTPSPSPSPSLTWESQGAEFSGTGTITIIQNYDPPLHKCRAELAACQAAQVKK